MALSRYNSYSLGRIKSVDSSALHKAIEAGHVEFKKLELTSAQRLDTLAGQYYGDSQYWWIIAIASGIGWGLQVPSGTLIRIPTNISQAISYIK